MSDLISQITGGLLKGPRRPSDPISQAAPNLCAHLSLMCALFPFAVVILMTLIVAMGGSILPLAERLSSVIVSVLTLAGALFGALGGRCYWRDVRRRGLGMSIVGLIGCGIWVVYYDRIFQATISLFQ